VKREILINTAPRETRVAILEDDQLVELLVERPDARRMLGDVYLGKVEAVLPGIQAAFVNIGTEKSAFLHASDVVFDESADPDDELDTFDYEAPGATWWDARWRAYVDGLAAPPTVVSVAADALGGLRVALSDGAALEVFPNSAPAEHVESEFWRLEAAGGAAFSAGTEGAAGGPA